MQEVISERRLHLLYPCLLLITLFFAIHFIIVPVLPSFWSVTPPLTLTPTAKSSTTAVNNDKNQCPYGSIFVYKLPIMFNIELLQNCHGLDPWNSFCAAVSNHGFGPTADDLSGVVPASLLPAWHRTHQFLLEVIFHHKLLKHRCRTFEPESSTAFYMPFYAGLALNKYLWFNCTAEEKDHHPNVLLKWVQDQPYFKRSNGSDHFITLGRVTWNFKRWGDEGWGSSFLKMPAMQNVLRLLIEPDPWDPQEIGVPYPTGFHPSQAPTFWSGETLSVHEDANSYSLLLGGKRVAMKNDFRGILTSQCGNSSSCKLVGCDDSNSSTQCRNMKPKILEAFLDSDFCLQPRGDSYTRRSVFDCMVAGSIPVFFWNRTAYDQYKWFLPSEPESYSFFIDYNEVKKNGSMDIISRRLESISREEVKKMRESVINLIPKLVYAKGQDVKDAFEVAVNGVLSKIKKKNITFDF